MGKMTSIEKIMKERKRERETDGIYIMKRC